MSEAVSRTMTVLCALTARVVIGTNMGLLHLLWALISGTLLPSRGALFPALQSTGLLPSVVRRAWAALCSNSWQISELLLRWEQYVIAQGQWQTKRYDGYCPKAIDITAFYRPTLKGCSTKHFSAPAGKALPAIVLGLIVRVGNVKNQRVALLTEIVRSDSANSAESAHRTCLLTQVKQSLKDDEMPVFDAGFKIAEMQTAGIERYVIRLSKNFTACCNQLPAYKGKGRKPKYGQKICPLAHTYKGKQIAATPPNRTETWSEHGITFRVEVWNNLVLPRVQPGPDAKQFHVAAVYDPRYNNPWLLACPINLSGQAWLGLYRSRWPVEQLPLAAKQMVGSSRQFVFAQESRQRLPELSLLVGNILTYLAAVLPAIPTGFWDRHPQPTAGRLRRALEGKPFSESYSLPTRLRKKESVSDHLPKGIFGHRRQKSVTDP